jgi:hypothetical protein
MQRLQSPHTGFHLRVAAAGCADRYSTSLVSGGPECRSAGMTWRRPREILDHMTISRDRLASSPSGEEAQLIRVRNGAAMFLAAASGATDAIGYLALGHVFTSAMTGNFALLGIALAHHDG